MGKVTFKMGWYTDDQLNRARQWDIYVDGVRDDLQICHVCKKYWDGMYESDPNYVKGSRQSYAVGCLEGWEDVYVGDYDTLAEAKQAAIEYLQEQYK